MREAAVTAYFNACYQESRNSPAELWKSIQQRISEPEALWIGNKGSNLYTVTSGPWSLVRKRNSEKNSQRLRSKCTDSQSYRSLPICIITLLLCFKMVAAIEISWTRRYTEFCYKGLLWNLCTCSLFLILAYLRVLFLTCGSMQRLFSKKGRTSQLEIIGP
jgi:hypothetical protein